MKNKISAAILISGGVLMNSGCSTATPSKEGMYFPDQQEICCRLKENPYKPLFPAAADRKAWNRISQNVRAGLIKAAEKGMKKPWPLLSAKDYMKFRRNGDRKAYETPYWEKRFRMVDLTLGECCEYKGRFTDEIIEGIWQILSEPVWCTPAHEGLPENELLPDPGRFKIDIFSAATGRLLCDVLALLEPELAAKSPFLVQRLKMELMRRIIEPAEKLNDENTWWFCGRNNWTPWCASNLIGCAVYLLDDQPERLAGFINTYLGISRRFYDRYPDDGDCNEGPSYWRHAPGKLIQLLHLLDHRLGMNGKMFDDSKLKRMCEYLPGMNLSGNFFLSASDAAPRIPANAQFLAFTAGLVKSSSVMALAQRLKNTAPAASKVTELDGALAALFTTVPEKQLSAALPAVNYWYNMGVCILREKPESPEKGTVVSLKGGHNAESHNHLDMGHFTLMHRNKPLIIDVGSGVYTAVTFSSKRYTLWNNNSTGHNAPRFDGNGQMPDVRTSPQDEPKFKAQIILENDSVASTVLDNAYPESVGMTALKRTISLDRKNGNVTVRDTAAVKGKKTVEITLFSAVEPLSFDARTVKWKKAVLTVNGLTVKSVVPEDRLDEVMKKNWKKLWRIELAGEIDRTGSWNLDFDVNQ
ncbi:MAG: heparinase II/III family protein [Lentisphaeria bacterium]|nr:heparinase II/III family protein [Lentisphaeria bacterium]